MAGETQALERRPASSLIVTDEQKDLLKKTFASEATDAELALFLYDCQRRGVHPLDRMLHFTKRQGKYTPITSIDFLRSRANETGEHMGTDDGKFDEDANGHPLACSVTVYRLVKGEKVPFTATARMAEYMPGPPNDFMWRKMPFGQLGKCAEALALRKGFPQETADLHTSEEMDQADAPALKPAPVQRASETKALPPTTATTGQAMPAAAAPRPAAAPKPVAAPPPPARQATAPAPSAPIEGSMLSPACPVREIRKIAKKGAMKNDMYVVFLEGDPSKTEYTTFSETHAKELASFKGTPTKIVLEYTTREAGTKTYHNIVGFRLDEPAAAAQQSLPQTDEPDMSDSEPFEP